jgi:hypothetical protein
MDMKILSGWKEIANHLHQGVRTVQRWELIGLPIHRVRLSGSSPVIAFAEELNAWEAAAPVRLLDVIGKLNAKVESLEGEVRSLKSISQTRKHNKRSRNTN